MWREVCKERIIYDCVVENTMCDLESTQVNSQFPVTSLKTERAMYYSVWHVVTDSLCFCTYYCHDSWFESVLLLVPNHTVIDCVLIGILPSVICHATHRADFACLIFVELRWEVAPIKLYFLIWTFEVVTLNSRKGRIYPLKYNAKEPFYSAKSVWCRQICGSALKLWECACRCSQQTRYKWCMVPIFFSIPTSCIYITWISALTLHVQISTQYVHYVALP